MGFVTHYNWVLKWMRLYQKPPEVWPAPDFVNMLPVIDTAVATYAAEHDIAIPNYVKRYIQGVLLLSTKAQ